MRLKKSNIGAVAVAAIVGGAAALAVTLFIQKEKDVVVIGGQSNVPVHYTNSGEQGGAVDLTFAAEQSVHAVVHVKVSYSRYVQNAPESFYDFFFGTPQYRQERTPSMGAGSGVIISQDGYIVTNNHVIDRAEDIQVTLNDKRTLLAKVVGTDPGTDIAVLKVAEKDLPFINFGSSGNLRLGEWVLAVGNPLNLTSTVTAGIVSAKARNINLLSENFKIESFIQTDAAVNPGNSGGALVNIRGELVGINTAIASTTGSFTGYSFAVPSVIVQKVAADIIEHGVVQRAVLGVSLMELTSEVAKELDIKDVAGVFVADAIEGGAAKKAGIIRGDVIIAVNDVRVNSVAELQEQISRFRPNDQITLMVNKDNKTRYVNVVLRNKDGGTDVVKKIVINSGKLLGAELQPMSDQLKKALRIHGGMQVRKLSQGKLQQQGVKEGYIILRVNRALINSVEDIEKAIGNKSNEAIFVEGIYPNGMRAYYAFE
ncbi:MAG: Do family serine endopeptidase [Prevotellaceae bacterium]|jgi:Do/DeqQ family serine protease|nr:Do family serine endopeptidase [Prevotellaceae bacterium]